MSKKHLWVVVSQVWWYIWQHKRKKPIYSGPIQQRRKRGRHGNSLPWMGCRWLGVYQGLFTKKSILLYGGMRFKCDSRGPRTFAECSKSYWRKESKWI